MNIKYLTSAGLTVVIAGIAVIILATGGGSAKTRPSQTAALGLPSESAAPRWERPSSTPTAARSTCSRATKPTSATSPVRVSRSGRGSPPPAR